MKIQDHPSHRLISYYDTDARNVRLLMLLSIVLFTLSSLFVRGVEASSLKDFYQLSNIDQLGYYDGIVVSQLLLPSRERNYLVVSSLGNRFFEQSQGSYLIVLLTPMKSYDQRITIGDKIFIKGYKIIISKSEAEQLRRKIKRGGTSLTDADRQRWYIYEEVSGLLFGHQFLETEVFDTGKTIREIQYLDAVEIKVKK